MNWTDTHCHLYGEQFDNDIDSAIQRALDLNVNRFLLPAIDSTYTSRLQNLAKQYPTSMFTMAGLHPCSVKENWEDELRKVKTQLFENKAEKHIAVGEIGMDLYWDKTFLSEQKLALKQQIEWAKTLSLPIVIHVRDAFEEIFDVIDPINDDSLKGVFHCFTGTLEQANHIINYGNFKLGIGGVLTFKNAGLDKVIEAVGLEHLILETDSPYLAPHPNRGKRNESSYLPLIADKLAIIKRIDLEALAQITERNTNEIFFPNQMEN